jgi:hypothetical protein
LSVDSTGGSSTVAAGNARLDILAGQVLLKSDVGATSPNLRIHVIGGSLTMQSTEQLAALEVDDSRTATVSPNGQRVIKTVALDLHSTGRLDLTDNKLITDKAPGTATGGVYDGLQREVQRARAGTAWNQPGLTTSMADAKTGKTTIGVSTGKQIRNLGPTQTALWGGQIITATSTLAMYTYAGDANLDGTIDAGDYGIIDNFVQVAGASGYGNGDFNYDGFIDAGDYGIIDNNIQAQGAPFPVGDGGGGEALASVTAVPEPVAAGWVVATSMMCLCRHRRRRAP